MLVMLFWAKKDVVCWFVAVGSSSSSKQARWEGWAGGRERQSVFERPGTVYPPPLPVWPRPAVSSVHLHLLGR